jgi:transposase
VIHQRLADEAGLEVSVASLRRYVRARFTEDVRRGEVVIWRPPVEPGDEAQVDYGYLGTWRDPRSGRNRRVWAFSMVLSFSRHLFVYPVLVMDQQAWVEAHVAAFEFLSGTPARIVLDNLRAGVIKPDIYDPKLNRAYSELGAHYGSLLDPARVGHPKDKPCATDCTSVSDGWENVVPWFTFLGGTGLGPILPHAVEPRRRPCDRTPRNRSGAVPGQPVP